MTKKHSKIQSSAAPHISDEELARLRGLINQEEGQELEQAMKQAVRQRRRAVHHQLASMENRNKRLLMWALVILLMLAVVSLWLFKFNQLVTRPSVSANYPASPEIDFEETKKNLSDTFSEVINDLDELKQQAAELKQEQGEETEAPLANEAAPIQ